MVRCLELSVGGGVVPEGVLVSWNLIGSVSGDLSLAYFAESHAPSSRKKSDRDKREKLQSVADTNIKRKDIEPRKIRP